MATSANSDAPSTARAVGQMKGSEARIDMRVAIVYTVRDGLIVRGREFASRDGGGRGPPLGVKISEPDRLGPCSTRGIRSLGERGC
jgi:hypothetical protein